MLSARQKSFTDHYVTCRNGAEAARRAGYAEPSARITASRLLTNNNIQVALAEKEAELKRLADIDKSRVISEVIAGVELARQQANPGSVIAGWVHIGKMLGVYAPEVRGVGLSAENAELQAKFEGMTDEQLLAIIEGGLVTQ
jgi:phage terminase small subunit